MDYEFVSTLATIVIASVAIVGLILRMDARMSRLEQRMTRQDERINGRIDALNGRIDTLGIRVDGLSERVSRIEGLLEGYFIRERSDGSPSSQE